jgi:hypothetical protein
VYKGLNAYLQANYVGVTDNYIIYELRDENPQAINLTKSKRYGGNQICTYAISIKDGKLYLLDACFFVGGFD